MSPESGSSKEWKRFTPQAFIAQGEVKHLEPQETSRMQAHSAFILRYRKLDVLRNKLDYYLTANGEVYFQQLSASGKRNLPPIPSPLSKVGMGGVISLKPNYETLLLEESELFSRLVPVLTFTPLLK